MTAPASSTMFRRAIFLVTLLAVEALVASTFLDGGTLVRKGGILSHFIALWGEWVVRGSIGFAALFATFAYLKHRSTLWSIAADAAASPLNQGLLLLHAAAIGTFAVLSAALYGPAGQVVPLDVLSVMWILAAAVAVASLAFAVAPAAAWIRLLRSTGRLWVYAAIASTAACLAGALSWTLWAPTTRLTFALVKLFLRPLVSDILVQPERMRVGTSRFAAIISPQCSGLEGAALLVVFAVVWMIVFRADIRFPRSFILIPAGVVLLFILNAARITALILIGNAGAREVAAGGFHSQAGWIAFNLVAFGLCIAARRSPWFSIRAPEPPDGEAEVENPTASYLLPFLAILAAGMISQAMSGGFEWLYSLRLLAAAAALWFLRRTYGDVDWRFGRIGLSVGVFVFVLWIALEHLVFGAASPAGIPAPLAAAPVNTKWLWISLRAAGAIITVPVAEELAFRGFALRRLISPHFETVPYRHFTVVSVAVSSVLFGLMHGDRWLAGTLAGACYALASIRGARLGEAVGAHATTNALLAAYVLLTGNWQLW